MPNMNPSNQKINGRLAVMRTATSAPPCLRASVVNPNFAEATARRGASWIGYALLVVAAAAGLCPAVWAEPGLRYYYPVPMASAPQTVEADVCVYGATPGGVTAAVQASRMGKRVVLVEFGRHVGGMTAGGLSDTDGGDKIITGGIADEFYARIGKRSGFRPSAAEAAFRALLADAHVRLFFEHRLKRAEKQGNRIVQITTEEGDRFRAAMFIDATYEGDLMARAGVSYAVGREGNDTYHETINGVIFGPKDNFDRPVDPYVTPGNPASGLLSGISPEPARPVGQGDKFVQAYNFRMWLAPADKGALPWPKPAGYDPARYALLLRYIQAGARHVDLHAGDNNNHHMFNGAFSTDDIGMNYAWPDADYPTREKIFQEHVTYQQGLMYFLANDPRVPGEIQNKVRAFGPAADEFTDTGGWPNQLYVREARRMVSDYVMTEHNGSGAVVAEDSIALASYEMDSHNTSRLVVDGKVANEGQTYRDVPRPFPLAYRAIVPREAECGNLLVVFCVSASHTGLSPLRMEPVLMITGQSAATAACLSIDAHCPVQKLDYARLRERLLADKQILKWNGPASGLRLTRLKGVVADASQARLTGQWIEGLLPGGYRHDGNIDKGRKSARFELTVPKDGRYEVRLAYVAHSNRATHVPVRIEFADGETTVTVNQREKPPINNAFISLGIYRFAASRPAAVTVGTEKTDGYVVIDAVQLLPVD